MFAALIIANRHINNQTFTTKHDVYNRRESVKKVKQTKVSREVRPDLQKCSGVVGLVWNRLLADFENGLS